MRTSTVVGSVVVLNQNIYRCWVSGGVELEHLPLLGQWLLYENIYHCWVSGCCMMRTSTVVGSVVAV